MEGYRNESLVPTGYLEQPVQSMLKQMLLFVSLDNTQSERLHAQREIELLP